MSLSTFDVVALGLFLLGAGLITVGLALAPALREQHRSLTYTKRAAGRSLRAIAALYGVPTRWWEPDWLVHCRLDAAIAAKGVNPRAGRE